MKKLTIFLTLSLIYFNLALPALAQVGSPTPSPAATGKAKPIKQQAQLAVLEQTKRIISKVEDRLVQYEQFIGKVEALRADLAAQNKDVTKLDSALRLARTQMGTSRNNIDDSKRVLLALNYTTDMKTLRQSIISEVGKIRNELKDLHRSVVTAFTLAKQAAGETTETTN
jgi:vacuolar-type H+-ATPase subunit I/STV1